MRIDRYEALLCSCSRPALQALRLFNWPPEQHVRPALTSRKKPKVQGVPPQEPDRGLAL